MEVTFYLPEKYLPDPARQEAWKAEIHFPVLESGKAASAHAWIYQTWLALSKAGLPVALRSTLPESGIVVTMTGFLDDRYRPPASLFLAGIVADYVPHPGAHLQIVQNSAHARRLHGAVFLPHWPQPGLLPRDPVRGEQFENLHFFGTGENLAPELRSEAWKKKLLTTLGLRLSIRPAETWHDYREADAVLAVRDFVRPTLWHKPATKLYNAWLAGVPFVGGLDSAFASDGRPGQNYLAAASPEETLVQLRRLRDDPVLKAKLTAEGRAAARQFDTAATTARWARFVQDLPAQAEKWRASSQTKRRWFFLRQRLRVELDRRLR